MKRTIKERYELFKEFRKQQKLRVSRSDVSSSTSTLAKFFSGVGIFIFALELIILGAFLGRVDASVEPYDMVDSFIIVICILDFIIRLSTQKMYMYELTPYHTLPIGKRFVVCSIMSSSFLLGINFFYLSFFLPFALVSVLPIYGFSGVLTYLIGLYLIILVNNFLYIITKSLSSRTVFAYLLPIVIYSLFVGELLRSDSVLMWASMKLCKQFMRGNIFAFIGMIALVLSLMYLAVSSVLLSLSSFTKVNEKVRFTGDYKSLSRLGLLGDYILLEIKKFVRAKTPRALLINNLALTVVFAALYAGEIYNSGDFIYGLCYITFASGISNNFLAFEGNYLDGLMTTKHSIYELLKAKYLLTLCFLFCIYLLFLPVAIIRGDSLLFPLCWCLMTAGLIVPLSYYMLLGDQICLPLDKSLTEIRSYMNQRGMSRNLIITVLTCLPLLIYGLLVLFFTPMTTYLIMISLSLLVILSYKKVIELVHGKFMRNKYKYMENLRIKS